ncbi:MAG: amino acid permease [Turicibacter sp.]|nr:amino acid permease [Turicibacter sp.]
MSQENKLKRELGLIPATAIVVGNMIGSGIFAAPQGLAAASTPLWTMVAWTITGIGSLLIALSFANLGTKFPETGGPVVYTRKAFGETTAFMVSFTFWIGLWVGNAAIIVTLTRYLSELFPVFYQSPLASFLAQTVMLWLFTWINIRGVKGTGKVSEYTLYIKFIALGLFIIVGLMGFNSANLSTVSESASALENGGRGLISTLPVAIGITLWSFIGIESAAVAGGEVANPEKNIRRSTMYGTIITLVIYMLISFVAMGAMSQQDLSSQAAPMATILNNILGTNLGGRFFALCIVLGGVGSGAGWVLSTGRTGFSMAEDGYLPKSFAKVNPKTGVPVNSLILASILTNVMFLLSFIGLTEAFDFLIAIASLTMMPAYIFTCFADMKLLRQMDGRLGVGRFIAKMFVPLLATIYILYVIYAVGAEYAMYTFLLLLAGIPVYIYTKMQNRPT